MKKCKHIIFDLDHTLWDFERNSSEVLEKLYIDYELSNIGDFAVDAFINTFHEINEILWDDFQRGVITKNEMRTRRFEWVLKKLGVLEYPDTEELGIDFLRLCPHKPHTMPYATETLSYLYGKYDLHILTNGFEGIQHQKLKSAGIDKFFQKLITSEKSGYKKPDTRMFQYLLDIIAADPMDCVMIGDNLHADIIGARDSKMHHIYFNPSKEKHQFDTIEVSSLRDLQDLF